MIPPLVALFAFPVVAVILFRALEPRNAFIWTVLLGYLFLPNLAIINLPVLPTMDKHTVPILLAMIGLAMTGQHLLKAGVPIQPGWIPKDRLVQVVLLMLFLGAFLTIATNRDALRYGPTVLPALRLYDGFSSVLGMTMLILPLLVARKYLADETGHRMLMKAMAIAASIYTLPIIFELVMSPQMNRIVYGYFPHSWRQHLRGGGYRPLVFLDHGLWLGIFMACSVLATFGLTRTLSKERKPLYFATGIWLFLILANIKTLGAFAITLVLLPMVLLLQVRMQLILAATIAASVLIYPTLRGAGLVPTETVINIARSIEDERARSLQHRLNNEDSLLARANERPFFGWGGYNRSRIYDEYGQDLSTTDGEWVIRIGQSGWFGYLGQFGLLCLPIVVMALRRRKYEISITASCLALVLAANLIDLIPNAGLTTVTWMIAGALIGRLEHARSRDDASQEVVETTPLRPSYTRFEHEAPPGSRRTQGNAPQHGGAAKRVGRAYAS